MAADDMAPRFAAVATALLDPATEPGIYPDYIFQGVRRSGRTRAVVKFLCGLQKPYVIFYVAQSAAALEMLEAEGAIVSDTPNKDAANAANAHLIFAHTQYVQILVSIGSANALRGGLNLCIIELPCCAVPDLACPVILI